MSRIELSLPVSNWRNKDLEKITQDLASAMLEFRKRPNIYKLRLNPQGELDLKKGVRRDTPIFERDYQALVKIESWILNGPTPYIVWISPPCEEVYPTSRFIFSKRQEDSEGKYSENWALRIENTVIDTLRIANQISEYSPSKVIYTDPEHLRESPIMFTPSSQENITDFLIRVTQEKNALLELSDGTIDLEKRAALEEAEKIIRMRQKEIRNADTFEKQVLVGAKIEQDASERKYKLSNIDDCLGISNTEALKRLGGYDSFYEMISGAEYKFVKNCGVCGESIYNFICKGYKCKSCREIYLGC